MIRVTLTRPENGHAIPTTMVEGIMRLIKTLAKDQSVVILDAEGKFYWVVATQAVHPIPLKKQHTTPKLETLSTKPLTTHRRPQPPLPRARPSVVALDSHSPRIFV